MLEPKCQTRGLEFKGVKGDFKSWIPGIQDQILKVWKITLITRMSQTNQALHSRVNIFTGKPPPGSRNRCFTGVLARAKLWILQWWLSSCCAVFMLRSVKFYINPSLPLVPFSLQQQLSIFHRTSWQHSYTIISNINQWWRPAGVPMPTLKYIQVAILKENN